MGKFRAVPQSLLEAGQRINRGHSSTGRFSAWDRGVPSAYLRRRKISAKMRAMSRKKSEPSPEPRRVPTAEVVEAAVALAAYNAGKVDDEERKRIEGLIEDRSTLISYMFHKALAWSGQRFSDGGAPNEDRVSE